MKLSLLLAALACATPLFADPPTVIESRHDGGHVTVTLSHPDTGWDHYADGWRIETADGTVIGTRDLLHPHVDEQPFTRSLSVSDLPNARLFVRARCSVDGWSGAVSPLGK